MQKIVFISGASSGIGRATAELFARNQYPLIISGRRLERLDALALELRESFQARVLTLKLDIRIQKEVSGAVAGLPEEWRDIGILINNAGLAVGMSPLHAGEIDDWERMIDTNIKGLLYLSRAVVPQMVEKGHGHIINIGSVAGKETYVNGNVYCATKHAVESLTRALRMELVNFGIRVTQIAPGAVESEFSEVRFKGDKIRASEVYKGFQPLRPEDVADAIFYAASRPPHVCINDLLIMPTAQADTVHWHKDPS